MNRVNISMNRYLMTVLVNLMIKELKQTEWRQKLNMPLKIK